jgi:hypothetical protein
MHGRSSMERPRGQSFPRIHQKPKCSSRGRICHFGLQPGLCAAYISFAGDVAPRRGAPHRNRRGSNDGIPGSEIMWPDPRLLDALLKAGVPVVAKVGPVVVRARVGVADGADLLDLLVAIFDGHGEPQGRAVAGGKSLAWFVAL